MTHFTALARRLFISLLAQTHTTELMAHRVGVSPFLPSLFVLRYANMGGLDPTVFRTQLAAARSLRDQAWCDYWDTLAAEQMAIARRSLRRLPSAPTIDLEAVARSGTHTALNDLRPALAPAAPILADHGPQQSHWIAEQIVSDADAATLDAVEAVEAWIRALTYYQVSAFPGHSPARTRAYWRSRRLFDALIDVLAPGMGVTIERRDIAVDGDRVYGYLVAPQGTGPHPTVVITNGLEGTVQELLLPLLKYRHDGLALFVMEMPGSYVYDQPMSSQSELVYQQVLGWLAANPRIDAGRLGMLGVSFGAYWSARMAATDPRLRCAVVCGAPLHHTFGPTGSIGTPEPIVGALSNTLAATGVLDLMGKLRSLNWENRYGDITIPLLILNGDNDTLCSTQDSIDLAERVPNARLVLYPDDDHCAMGHYREWLDESHHWLREQLGALSDTAIDATSSDTTPTGRP